MASLREREIDLGQIDQPFPAPSYGFVVSQRLDLVLWPLPDEWSAAEHTAVGRNTKARERPMLILTRREGEVIRIGNSVQVVVVAIQGGQVKLGIEAPREITILRQELIGRRQQAAALTETPEQISP